MKLEQVETERLILDPIKETDKEDYFINISHDKKVLETFVCRYEETMEEFDFSSYPGRQDLFAIRLKKTGRSFGSPTAGYASTNTIFRLYDGAQIVLTVGADVALRTGKVFCE